MKKENEKLEARVEALENRVRTLEAMFNSLSAVSACAPRGAEVPNGGSLSAAMHMAAKPSKYTQSAYARPCARCVARPQRARNAAESGTFATACPQGQMCIPCGRKVERV
ncbi:MAG: hypothetical protein IKN59_09005 [Paludibacteraceae bacterium]|nr:hypothetical protein [Paludibacteraceae bacterium]